MPDLIGMTEAQARAAIGDAGLAVGQPEYVADADVAKDKVVKQDPNRDTFVDPGATVTITVSTGKPMTSVPAVVGQDRSTARATMESANLVAALVEESDAPKDQVIETDPAAGEEVPEGTKITVYFSDGPEKVPDVVGMTEGEAEQALKQAGFKAFVTTSNDTDEPKGTVINQNPEGGSERPGGDLGDDRGLVVRGAVRDPHPDTERHPDGAADRHAYRDPQRRPPDTVTSLVEEVAQRPSRDPARVEVAFARHRVSRRDFVPPQPAARARSAVGIQRLGVGDVEQTVVRRGGDGGLDVGLPADGDVRLCGVAAVELEVVVLGDRRGERVRVADGGDRVGLGVRHTLELHAVADALDARGADDALALDG